MGHWAETPLGIRYSDAAPIAEDDQPFGLAEDVYSRATGRKVGTVGGYEDDGRVQVNDAGPFDTPTLYRADELTDTPPPAPIATRRAGGLQAGTVKIGDDLEVYYSYATPIGFRLVAGPPTFTDAYYSVRTEAHAAEFGIRSAGAVVLPDPTFRAELAAHLAARGAKLPDRDFTNRRETSFPQSPFFHGKPARGLHPRAGQYVYVVRDNTHNTGCDATGHPYRVKAVYMGLVKADDPEQGHKKGDRLIRPTLQGFGPATEAVHSDLCQTEGGWNAFPVHF